MTLSRTFTHQGQSYTWTISEPPAPPAPADSGAPGAGTLKIEPLQLLPAILRAEQDTVLVAAVTGDAIAYIFIELWLYDDALGYAYGPVYQEYLHTSDHAESGGVTRPVWPEKAHFAVTLRPALRALSDGATSALVCAVPEAYAAPEATVYRVPGQFTAVASEGPRPAWLCFDAAGRMTRLLGMGGRIGRGPRALDPAPGDTFTPEGRILLPPQTPGAAWGEGVLQMLPLTFPETPFHWETLPPLPHTYLAGVVAQDFDGNLTRRYTPLIVLPAPA